METSVHDRRRVTRWPVRLLAKCLWEAGGRPREADAWVNNVHENGLSLEHDAGDIDGPAPRPGIKVVVRGFFYDERGDRAVPVRVRWVKPGPDGAWSAGVEFADSRRGKGLPDSFRDFLRVVRSETT